MSQYRLTRYALLSLLAIATAGCDDDDSPATGPQSQTAQVRIVNAADIADVQVRRVGSQTALATNLDFRGSTAACVEVPVGEQALVFSSSGIPLATTPFTFEAGETYTAILVASGPTRRAIIVPDDEIASTGNNALRFVNATSDPGDIYVTAPGGAVGPAFLAGGNIGVAATGNDQPQYVHRSTAHTQVRLFDTGVTAGTPRVDFALAGLPASRLATVVLTEGTPSAFMVIPCP